MINMKKKFISLLMIIARMFSMLPANVVDIKAATGKTGGCFTAELSGTIHTGNLCDPFPLRKNSEIIKS